MKPINPFVVLISADAEWTAVCDRFSNEKKFSSPYGQWFSISFSEFNRNIGSVIFFHGGWGKVAAAASTQFLIQRWKPRLIVNLGTCGGFDGSIERDEILLVDKTVIYDIYEQMGDPDEHIQCYVTDIDTSWITQPYPITVRKSLLVSGDRDIFSHEIPDLIERYHAVAGDWESGAIAWVAAKNNIKCLILRGVTDLISTRSGEAYNGNVNIFYENTKVVMKILLDSLPKWLLIFLQSKQISRLEK